MQARNSGCVLPEAMDIASAGGTPDKRDVWAIAAALSLDRDAVVGNLARVWLWFEQYTENGNTAGVFTALVDGSVNSIENGRITMPHFDWHTGASANRRVGSATRVSRHKRGCRGLQIAWIEDRVHGAQGPPIALIPL